MNADHHRTRHDDDRTGDNDINDKQQHHYDDEFAIYHDIHVTARRFVNYFDLHVCTDNDAFDSADVSKLDYVTRARDLYDYLAAVLGTDNTATDLDALRAAYIDAHAMYTVDVNHATRHAYADARDALCAALRLMYLRSGEHSAVG